MTAAASETQNRLCDINNARGSSCELTREFGINMHGCSSPTLGKSVGREDAMPPFSASRPSPINERVWARTYGSWITERFPRGHRDLLREVLRFRSDAKVHSLAQRSSKPTVSPSCQSCIRVISRHYYDICAHFLFSLFFAKRHSTLNPLFFVLYPAWRTLRRCSRGL